jgi:4'-phosphopantetheinyl transferase EntD
MTHCAGYRAAAVAYTRTLVTLGIDAEPALALPAGVLGMVASADETADVAGLAAADPTLPWDRLSSAPRGGLQAWFPMTGRWLLRDATVRLRRHLTRGCCGGAGGPAG